MTQPVFRFAPSPNGHLHLGHALSALLNAELAERMGGRLLLRIEDIDPGRSSAVYEAAILEDLDWLGLRWEEPVRRQSLHLHEHAAALHRLREKGLVYPCFCSRSHIRAAAGPDAAADPDGAPLYPGTCRATPAAEATQRAAASEPHVLRLDMKRALVAAHIALVWTELEDAPHKVTAEPQRWGDVVLARRDVPTSYHLAVTLDDAEQDITHVVRGRDLFHATSVHRLLQQLLKLPVPQYRHHRLVLDAKGRKLAKSAGSQSLRALRESGATPADIRRSLGL